MNALIARVARLRRNPSAFLAGSATYIGATSLGLAVNGIGSMLAARSMGPAEWGKVVWFSSGTTTVALFADALGIYYSNMYLVASRRAELSMPAVRGTVLAYGTALGAVVGLGVAAIPQLRAVVFRGFGEEWRLPILLNVLGIMLFNQIRGLILGEKRFLDLAVMTLVKSGGFGILAGTLAIALHVATSVPYGFAHVAGTWLSVLFCLTGVVRSGVALPTMAHLRACLRLGWRAAGINWVGFLHQRVDQGIVNVMLGSRAVGLYGVAVAVGELLAQIPAMMGMVLFPLVASAQDKAQAARETLARTRIVTAVFAVLMIGVWFAAPLVVKTLYGAQFLDAVPLLRIYLPGVVFYSGLLLVNPHISGMGYPPFQLISITAALALNVALNLILLRSLGSLGAPLASSLSYAVWLALGVGYLVYIARSSRREGPRSGAPDERLDRC